MKIKTAKTYKTRQQKLGMYWGPNICCGIYFCIVFLWISRRKSVGSFKWYLFKSVAAIHQPKTESSGNRLSCALGKLVLMAQLDDLCYSYLDFCIEPMEEI